MDESVEEKPIYLNRKLPDDLPTSLDDRKFQPILKEETEVYDAWQGQSQILTTPVASRPLPLPISTSEAKDGNITPNSDLRESNARLSQMLAAQARLSDDEAKLGNGEQLMLNKDLTEPEKKDLLQNALTMASSNGDSRKITELLQGSTRFMIDVNGVDSDGTPPIVYASCFGHEDAVSTLLNNGANVDAQDSNKWSALMWAMTNHHNGIAKLLLQNGASPNVKSFSGRTAFDFAAPDSDMTEYLYQKGYKTDANGITDDYYNPGSSQDLLEEEMAENEMKRRMMMESALNLEVDIGNLGLDEQPESPEDLEGTQDFTWDRCLNDQMFVFQEKDLQHILNLIITNMTPQRSPSQKPIPANILFLGARYAFYHANTELLDNLLNTSLEKINDVVEKHQWDMTLLAFWMSNATLLLYYLKKDTKLSTATTNFQLQTADLINEIYILVIRDAERRMDKIFDQALLEYETIPGFEDVHFQNEWKIFRSKPKSKATESIEVTYRPPSPKRRAQISPRNITSLLSSILFVLDLYDIHSVITAQIISQLFYWLGAEMFNRIMSNKTYLARTKAMQIRMNVSTLEDWARTNNRKPDHYENGSMTSLGEHYIDIVRHHLAPTVQLLQWLQCFSSLGDDFEALVATLQQFPRLVPQQLVHAASHYRAEVGEKGLHKSATKYMTRLQKEITEKRAEEKRTTKHSAKKELYAQNGSDNLRELPQAQDISSSSISLQGDVNASNLIDNLLFDPAFMLPFLLPTSTDMLVSYGAGFGGVNKEQEQKYVPTVPPEMLAKLDVSSLKGESEVC